MGKHLTAEERSRIESWLREGRSLSAIARSLGKSVSTISREVKSRSTPSNKSAVGRIPNRCIQRANCFKSNLCDDPRCNRERCSSCKLCNSVCPDFREEHCSELEKPPYVCNGCKTEHRCTLRKRYYLHGPAQEDYEETLVSSREGVNITELEIARLDEFFSPLIEMGQGIHHIFVQNPNEFTFCERTMYKYINLGLFRVRNIDLLRKCKFKPRKKKSMEHKIDKNCRVNRTYQDYLKYLEANPDTAVVQMDSVLGELGGSVLLTMTFTSCSLMLAFIRERNTAQKLLTL